MASHGAGGVVSLPLPLLPCTCACGTCSVVFNFLGRDFFTALSDKDEVAFKYQLMKYLAGFALGIPVFVFKSYFQVRAPLLCDMFVFVCPTGATA